MQIKMMMIIIMYFSKLRCSLNNLYNVHIGDVEMSVYHFCSAISSILIIVIILISHQML